VSLTELLDPRPDDGTRVAVYIAERSVTRRRLREQALALAAVLREAGFAPGRKVAVMLPNSPELVAALFGTWFAQGAYVPVNPRLSDPELAHILDSLGPAVIVTDAEHRGRFGDLPVVLVRPDAGPDTDTVWTAPGRPVAGDAVNEPDIALVQFTSGTTGPPKAVLLRHEGIRDLLEPVLRKLLGGASSTVAQRPDPMPNLIPTSLSLWAGIYNVLFAFRVGAPVVLTEGFDTRRFAADVARFGIRSAVLPPAALVMLADDERVDSLKPLKYVRSITAALSPLQARRFRDRFGVTVLNCYGQTEIGGEIVGWNAADARAFGDSKLGAVGRPHDGVALRVVDAEGTRAAPGGQGELWVRVPASTAGYADGSDFGDRLGPDGWLRTGDVARIDEDGFLWIEGRVSDMINRGGLKVFPAEVEEVLRLAPQVAECAVVGVADDRLGEIPWAFIVPRPGATADAAALAALCRAHLAPYKVPVRFREVALLPRNEAGKVLARQLVRLALADEPG